MSPKLFSEGYSPKKKLVTSVPSKKNGYSPTKTTEGVTPFINPTPVVKPNKKVPVVKPKIKA